jgi:hypothetical protein
MIASALIGGRLLKSPKPVIPSEARDLVLLKAHLVGEVKVLSR